jgi:hypothetical protein
MFRTVLVELALLTYVVKVVISLIGRRSLVTRWFLNPNPPAEKGESA